MSNFNNYLLKNEKVKRIIASPIRPTLKEIMPVIREMNVSSVSRMWEIFDQIQLLWACRKDTHTSLDDIG